MAYTPLAPHTCSASPLPIAASADREPQRCLAPNEPAIAASRYLLSSSTSMTAQQLQPDRKDSMINDSNGLESDVDHYWNTKYESHDLGIDHQITFTPTNPFYNSAPAYSLHGANNTNTASALHQGQWTFDHTADSGTSVHFDYSPVTDFESSAFHHEHADRMQPAFSAINQAHDVSDSGHSAGHHIKRPLSPDSASDWMIMAEQESHGHVSSIPRRMRVPHGRRLSSAADCLRSDLARKKNTKIDIPSERNLVNIDRLIEESTNEAERKELKSQRRLLRNREAALASRQRKKKHTEDLEIKEKDYSSRVRLLENKIQELDIAFTSAEQDKQHLMQQNLEARNHIEGMHLEMEEMIIKHTRETSALRRQLQISEQREDSAAPIMSAAPSSSGYNEVTNNMDALSVNPHYCFGSTPPDQQEMQYQQQKPSVSCTIHHNNQQMPSAAIVKPAQHEQPVASSILFMLLLCGAFVASRSSSRSILPRLPEEVKAASSTVLDSLLRETNSASFTGHANHKTHSFVPAEPVPSRSGNSWQVRAGDGQARGDNLPRSMTAPIGTDDQFFTVLPSEYSSMTRHDSYGIHQDAVPRTFQRNLAEVLSTLHAEKAAQGNNADIYTRSLLWDQIPADVVNQFKGMIQETRRVEEGETSEMMHQHASFV